MELGAALIGGLLKQTTVGGIEETEGSLIFLRRQSIRAGQPS